MRAGQSRGRVSIAATLNPDPTGGAPALLACEWTRPSAARSTAPALPARPPPARYQVAWPPVWCKKTNQWVVAKSAGRAPVPRMDPRCCVRKHLALCLLLEERQRRLAKLGDVLSGEAREELQVLVQRGGGRSRRHGHAGRGVLDERSSAAARSGRRRARQQQAVSVAIYSTCCAQQRRGVMPHCLTDSANKLEREATRVTV